MEPSLWNVVLDTNPHHQSLVNCCCLQSSCVSLVQTIHDSCTANEQNRTNLNIWWGIEKDQSRPTTHRANSLVASCQGNRLKWATSKPIYPRVWLNFFIDEQEKNYPWISDLRAISSSSHSLVEGIDLKYKSSEYKLFWYFSLGVLSRHRGAEYIYTRFLIPYLVNSLHYPLAFYFTLLICTPLSQGVRNRGTCKPSTLLIHNCNHSALVGRLQSNNKGF